MPMPSNYRTVNVWHLLYYTVYFIIIWLTVWKYNDGILSRSENWNHVFLHLLFYWLWICKDFTPEEWYGWTFRKCCCCSWNISSSFAFDFVIIWKRYRLPNFLIFELSIIFFIFWNINYQYLYTVYNSQITGMSVLTWWFYKHFVCG